MDRIDTKLKEDFTLEYSLTHLVLNPEKKSTWIHALRTTNYFTKDLFLKNIDQLNSSIDKTNIQVLLVCRFQLLFGAVQLV